MTSKWQNLVMWDNISFCYKTSEEVKLSVSDLKDIKKILNSYMNKIAYDGYISNNRVNMAPSLKYDEDHKELDYNVSAYPNPIPKNFPEHVFSILPKEIVHKNVKFVKKNYHSV